MLISIAHVRLREAGVLVTPKTIRCWCQDHGIGIRRGGRWYVNPAKLADHVALPASVLTAD